MTRLAPDKVLVCYWFDVTPEQRRVISENGKGVATDAEVAEYLEGAAKAGLSELVNYQKRWGFGPFEGR